MNNKLYEAIRPVRGREQKEKEHWFIRFADIYPRSLSASMLGGYFVLFGGLVGWCWKLYH